MTLTDRRSPRDIWYLGAFLAAVCVLAACNQAPAIQRPREGAAPVVAGATPFRLENLAPPTLSIAGGLLPTPTWTPTVEPTATRPPPRPSPGPFSVPNPNASPGLSPLITGLQPAPGSNLPAGDVVISARISGSSELVDVSAFVDGEAVPLDLGNGTVRAKTISFVRTFISGTHEVRIQARDERGQVGGYRWQFSVGGGRPGQAAPTARLATSTPFVPQFTPIPMPTRRPTSASAPVPAPRVSPTP